MKQPKHTPGPWQIMGQDLMAIKVFSDDSEQPLIGKVRIYKGNEEVAKANARLIAAAPELLKALEYARGYVPEVCNDEIDATIAKARGEA